MVMDSNPHRITDRMLHQVARWRAQQDRRAIFLECYAMMTANMLDGVEAGRFLDREWVTRLLHHFADYYFIALDQYEAADPQTPAVWQEAFAQTRKRKLFSLQDLFLGINAHINFDLVFTLADLLEPEWGAMAPADRRRRYEDHCRVNDIIAETIDRVQDEVIEQQTPWLDLVDRLFGRLDERSISALLIHWREEVWSQATRYVETPPAGRPDLQQLIEKKALQRGRRLLILD